MKTRDHRELSVLQRNHQPNYLKCSNRPSQFGVTHNLTRNHGGQTRTRENLLCTKTPALKKKGWFPSVQIFLAQECYCGVGAEWAERERFSWLEAALCNANREVGGGLRAPAGRRAVVCVALALLLLANLHWQGPCMVLQSPGVQTPLIRTASWSCSTLFARPSSV